MRSVDDGPASGWILINVAECITGKDRAGFNSIDNFIMKAKKKLTKSVHRHCISDTDILKSLLNKTLFLAIRVTDFTVQANALHRPYTFSAI